MHKKRLLFVIIGADQMVFLSTQEIILKPKVCSMYSGYIEKKGFSVIFNLRDMSLCCHSNQQHEAS